MEKSKVIIGALLGVILIGSVLLVERSMRQRSSSPGQAQVGTQEGQLLPNDIEFHEFNSKKPTNFSKYKGKVVLINFWASWCEACMAEMPSIQKLYSSLQSEGLEVLAINVDENPENVIPKIVDDLELNFPIFMDTSGELSKFFDVVAIPFTIVAGRDQKIIWAESGERDWSTDQMLAKMKELLK